MMESRRHYKVFSASRPPWIRHQGRHPEAEERVAYGMVIVLLALVFLTCFIPAADAKIYIDITNPAAKMMPIAIYDFQGPNGKELAEVVREDLIFTGLFMYIDKASYLEGPTPPYNPKNWTPLGIGAVVKGTIGEGKNLTASVSLYDPIEDKEILSKQYQSDRDLLRQLGHSIANDIYAALTGSPGIFRTRIAYVAEQGGSKDIYLADWDGHRSRKLGLKDGVILSPHWSPDGSRLIYAAERGRQWGIYLLDFLQMTDKRVFTSRGINVAGDFFPGGKAFAFSSSKDGTPDLHSFTLSSGTAKKLTSSYGIEVSPAVSSDGTQIAFVSDRGGSPQVYVMRSDGTEVRRVTHEGSYNTSPAWSPSGDRIVFSGRRGGKNQICIVKPDGSELMQLTEQGNNEDPSFSPDGRYIAFTSDRDKGKGVFIMRANGESQKRITPSGVRAFGPRWSPQ